MPIPYLSVSDVVGPPPPPLPLLLEGLLDLPQHEDLHPGGEGVSGAERGQGGQDGASDGGGRGRQRGAHQEEEGEEEQGGGRIIMHSGRQKNMLIRVGRSQANMYLLKYVIK